MFKKFITYSSIIQAYNRMQNREICIYEDDLDSGTRKVLKYDVYFFLSGKVSYIMCFEYYINRLINSYNSKQLKTLEGADAVEKYKELTSYENEPMKKINNFCYEFKQSVIDSPEVDYYKCGKHYYTLFLKEIV